MQSVVSLFYVSGHELLQVDLAVAHDCPQPSASRLENCLAIHESFDAWFLPKLEVVVLELDEGITLCVSLGLCAMRNSFVRKVRDSKAAKARAVQAAVGTRPVLELE